MDTPSGKRTRHDEEVVGEPTPKRMRESPPAEVVLATPQQAAQGTSSLFGSIRRQFSRFGSLRITGTTQSTNTQAVNQPRIQDRPVKEAEVPNHDIAEATAQETPLTQPARRDYRRIKFDPSKSIFSGKQSPFAGPPAGVDRSTEKRPAWFCYGGNRYDARQCGRE